MRCKLLIVKLVIGAWVIGFGGKLVGYSQLALDPNLILIHHPINIVDGYFAVFAGAIMIVEAVNMLWLNIFRRDV